jgi:hypothetical protein
MESHSEAKSPLVLSILSTRSRFESDISPGRCLCDLQKVTKLRSDLSAKCQGN